MDRETSSQQQIAVRIVDSASLTERDALKIWIKELLDIRDTDASPTTKAKRALTITATNKVLWPMIKLISRGMKLYGWDNRKTSTRFGLAGAAVGVALLGSQGAGIAALGGAVGVPLWVVLGAGAKFAHMLYDELLDKADAASTLKTTYTVIDAEKEGSQPTCTSHKLAP